LVSFLPPSFQVNDEIYQTDDFDPRTSHVLLRLDPSSVDLKKQGARPKWYGWPVAWTRMDGKGRVFYSTFGHTPESWDRPDIQKMWLEATKWCLGLITADATPRPRPAD